jgi:2-octaprenyl-6-methoxyphenol hydroxylase
MEYEVIIIGGGIIGITTAYALAASGIKIALVEQNSAHNIHNLKQDGRASALAHSTKQIYEHYGLWKKIEPNTGLIENIRVTDNYSPCFLHFDNAVVDNLPLGYMIENNDLLSALYKEAANYNNLTIFFSSQYKNIEFNAQEVKVILDQGQILTAKLLIAADGKNSAIRTKVGIEVTSWDYPQSAIVCNVHHELNHRNIAQEMFLPAGPFAILPLKGGYHSSLVWTEERTHASLLIKMKDSEFIYFLKQRFTDYLGEITLSSSKFCYPLSVSHAKNYYSHRTVLIGDAAHFIHPIAGQGLNLSLRDVAQLVRTIKEYLALGYDIGQEVVLSSYEISRRKDNLAMVMITDGLNRLFSNEVMPIATLRKLGLSTVNNFPKLKKFFIEYAMGKDSVNFN